MAEARIGRAVLQIAIDDKEYRLALEGIKDNSEKTAQGVASIGQAVNLAVFREFAQIAAGAVRAVAGAIIELSARGAEVAGVEQAFNRLTASVGETKEEMLETTRTATKGLITDFDIMAASNKAMLLGLPVTSKSMGTMAQAAVVLGRAMKQDAGKSFDDLITALGRGSPQILDNLGLSVKLSEANEAYAKTLGKSAKELTEGEQKTAFYNAAMDAASKKVAEVGGIHLTLADMVKVAGVTMTNFTDRLGVSINQSPVLRAGMEAVGKAISEAFGPNQGEAISFLTKAIESIAIFAVQVAQVVVEAGRFMANQFLNVKIVFNALLEAIFTGIQKASDVVRDLAQQASSLPVVGEGFKKIADAMARTGDFAGSMAIGFREVKDSAFESQDAINSGFDKVGQVLTSVQAAMEAARGKSVQVATDTGTAFTGMGEQAAAGAGRTEEAATKIAQTYEELIAAIDINTKVGVEKRLAELDLARTKEIEGLRSLKDLSRAEYDQLVSLVNEKYAQMSAAASLGSDEIRDRTIALQQEIALANETGTAQRLLQLEFARQKEIESLAFLRANYATEYEMLVALVNEKYAQMNAAATGHGLSVEQAAAAAGFKTRAELEATAARAIETYQRMKESGLFTAKEIEKAHEAAEAAKREATGKTKEYTLTAGQALMGGATQILDVLGQKHKTAAIAGAIIATYLAVSKALASAPWPFSLALAAGALAAGMANVNRIRSSQPGYKEGTPGLDFMNFGRMSFQPLHGTEAVIPSGSGHLLAREIAAAMPGADSLTLSKLSEIADGIASLPQSMRRAFRDGLLQARA